MHLNNDQNLTILENAVKSVHFPVGEAYEDEASKILSTTKENEDPVCFVSDDEDAS